MSNKEIAKVGKSIFNILYTNNWIGLKGFVFLVAEFSADTKDYVKVSSCKKCPPPDYEAVPGLGYYKLYGKNQKRSWIEAEALCEFEGGHLVVIDSEHELQYVRNIAIKYYKENDYIHMGLHDQYTEGRYVTIHSKLQNGQ